MRLRNVEISGFRGYAEPTSISIDESFTALVGKNDAGKSTVLEALDIYFGNSKPEVSDFSIGGESPIRIVCEFDTLPQELILDTSYETSLADEYLLNDNGLLSFGKEWTRSKAGTPSLFVIANHPELDTGDELITLSKANLIKVANSLEVDSDTVSDKRTNSAYRKAVWDSTLHSGRAELTLRQVPLEAVDAKKVGEQLNLALPIYQLFKSDRVGTEKDDLAQDPAKAVIQDVLSQHQETLDELSATMHGEISRLLGEVVAKLGEVAPDLADALSPANMKPNWSKAYSALEFVDDNGIPLSKRGSGTRRLVLFSFFRANAEDSQFSENNGYHRGIITAVEEPETALHADLQLETLGALTELASHEHRQVLITTHSPNLVKDVPFQSIRYIRRNASSREVIDARTDEDGARLIRELNYSLGILSDHNVRCFLLIEGIRDIESFTAFSDEVALQLDDPTYSFSQMKRDGKASLISLGGGASATLWDEMLGALNRKIVYVVDSDRERSSAGLKKEVLALIRGSNEHSVVHVLDKRELENYIPRDEVICAYSDIANFEREFLARLDSALEWDYIDLPDLCAQAVHAASATEGNIEWDALDKGKRDRAQGRAKRRLARLFGSSVLVAEEIADNGELFRIVDLVRAIVFDAQSEESKRFIQELTTPHPSRAVESASVASQLGG
ncbi:ATP-binding protein [uncultured Brachybacterium sp.]|uniref:ATP-binding protein n=1 Tax=uncultured Brachybacterium sp. TaxID=189680 RepID=UPI00260CEE2B|nr:ATP-binding protein [uncultured Brachybacterium sp.]